MRHRIKFAALPLLLMILVGCAAKNPTATLPTGAIDQTDATVYRILSDAQAFLSDIRAGVSGGSLKLTATQQTAFNDLVKSYNVTEAAWQAYHAGASRDSASLTASANALNSSLASAQSSIVVASK
jgi:hypothetical protein